jgi:hypothetical protein
VPEQNTQISENKVIRYSIPIGMRSGLTGCNAARGEAEAVPRMVKLYRVYDPVFLGYGAQDLGAFKYDLDLKYGLIMEVGKK